MDRERYLELLDELRKLEHDIPFIEHEMTFGYWTEEDLLVRLERAAELRALLFG